jgi:hypothetical protein
MLLSRIRILSLYLQLCHSFTDPAPEALIRLPSASGPQNLFFGGAFVAHEQKRTTPDSCDDVQPDTEQRCKCRRSGPAHRA